MTRVMKPNGTGAKLTRVEADNKTLRDKNVQMKGVEQSQHVDYMELSDKCTRSASRVAQLIAENERLRSERHGTHGTHKGGHGGRKALGTRKCVHNAVPFIVGVCALTAQAEYYLVAVQSRREVKTFHTVQF